MPRVATPLSDTKIRRAKATDKPLKFFDGGGLNLYVLPTGGKFWRFQAGQRQGELAHLGSLPLLTLAEGIGLHLLMLLFVAGRNVRRLAVHDLVPVAELL